jgi:hypothetical protein
MMRIYWDRGGRNVGRFQRFIYVEWEDPSDPYNRLLVDITYYADDFIEDVVLPALAEYLRRVPPLHVRRLGGAGECEFLVVDASARPFVIATKWPYSLIDYTLYWKRVRRARLVSRYRNFFLDAPGVAAEVDAVEIDAGSASLLVPRSVYERWLAMKGKLESMMQRIVQQMELEEARQRELRQRELRIVFE